MKTGIKTNDGDGKRISGIRFVGDQGQKVNDFNGLRVRAEMDPEGLRPDGTSTIVVGTIYAAYINKDERTGLICFNVDLGQKYMDKTITRGFALFVEPYQILDIWGKGVKEISQTILSLDAGITINE